MAAPATIDIKNLQGKWLMNKSLSDNSDPALSLQGMGWLTRKAIGAAVITQHLNQSSTTGDNGEPCTLIEIDQLLSGGMKGTTERRILDWSFRPNSDRLFGELQGRSRYTTLANIIEESKGKGVTEGDAKYLAEGWLKETEDGEIVESFVDNEKNKWTGWQVWGFAEIKGERKLTRRFAVRKTGKDEVVRIRLVYDYLGSLE
ncbi:hypothetical protein P153DRAFT_174751 [Dothidotthia symphoricarpi CBS 119687]|uniref:Uncharacterized protein n=1 Tax=Dothidotthia symphoricarpi CBS 119687 TaxID=1392245 RepID=A0A6A6ANR7_9PLEO|nr:uncharacterized protein P153DRAFT_174751 [Dothidotthia symphoricarpi CBS 119687]KAF2132833.1 hypothetical protein P153DRAFT_174751 [Dothidotthia symphoricarpi CBS 119687]